MKGIGWSLAVVAGMLVGLPLAGVWLSGGEVGGYLRFPPETVAVSPPGFSPVVFGVLLGVLIAVLAPFGVRVVRSWGGERVPAAGRFPVWGWAGVMLGAAAWILAWTRMDWFARWQAHTFTPLWIAYILVVNGLTCRRTGGGMMLDRPAVFLSLFPLSALFWWFFEYLNRFVRNWHYLGGVQDMSPLQYVVFATIPFATVLPAVLGTRELLATYPLFTRAFGQWRRVVLPRSAVVAGGLLAAAAAGLAGIGVWPNQLFPLLWVSPLLIVVALQELRGGEGLAGELARGDWRRVVTVALAALVCGFFWEMWNSQSQARWVYQIPYVQGARLFEMPLLGYAGYFPFGLECLVIGDLARRKRMDQLAGAGAAASPAESG